MLVLKDFQLLSKGVNNILFPHTTIPRHESTRESFSNLFHQLDLWLATERLRPVVTRLDWGQLEASARSMNERNHRFNLYFGALEGEFNDVRLWQLSWSRRRIWNSGKNNSY